MTTQEIIDAISVLNETIKVATHKSIPVRNTEDIIVKANDKIIELISLLEVIKITGTKNVEVTLGNKRVLVKS
jgi:hypothetical protein